MRLGQPRFAMLIRIENYRRAKTAVRQLFQERVDLQNARDQITIIKTRFSAEHHAIEIPVSCNCRSLKNTWRSSGMRLRQTQPERLFVRR